MRWVCHRDGGSNEAVRRDRRRLAPVLRHRQAAQAPQFQPMDAGKFLELGVKLLIDPRIAGHRRAQHHDAFRPGPEPPRQLQRLARLQPHLHAGGPDRHRHRAVGLRPADEDHRNTGPPLLPHLQDPFRPQVTRGDYRIQPHPLVFLPQPRFHSRAVPGAVEPWQVQVLGVEIDAARLALGQPLAQPPDEGTVGRPQRIGLLNVKHGQRLRRAELSRAA